MLITLNDLFTSVKDRRYAVPALVADGHVFMEGIVAAAEQTRKPVIVMLPALIFHNKNFRELAEYTLSRIKTSNVPMVLHLDHSPDVETVIEAIHYGFSSVMIDASDKSYEDNLQITKEVVRLAHACGISVEAEIGHVADPHAMEAEGAVPGILTDTEEAVRFAKESGIDALAIAVGSVHGIYHSEPDIHYETIEKIRNETSIPLVMHGASGLSDDVLHKSMKVGMNKINYFTELSRAAIAAMKKEIEESPDTVFLHDYINAAQKAVEDTVVHLQNVLDTPDERGI